MTKLTKDQKRIIKIEVQLLSARSRIRALQHELRKALRSQPLPKHNQPQYTITMH